MKRKILFPLTGLFLLLFMGLLWLSYNNIGRRIAMMNMELKFQAAKAALHSGKKKFANYSFKSAMFTFQQNEARGVYYPERSSEYFTAGNICQQIRQPRQALQHYKAGLCCNPWSITLLSNMGVCAYRLGEYPTALAALEKSQSIYPLKKKLRPILQKLSAGVKGG